jgi:DhnA family fructose-bisphosphate aldolase class Ia
VLSAAIAAGLGASSARTWLKLPVVDDMARVMDATTLPTLLLGGDPDGELDETFDRWERALALPGVRGLVVGRTLLYPPDDDVERAVATAARLVHPGEPA